MTLHRNSHDLNHWYVCLSGQSWLKFPARINGWLERRRIPPVDALSVREVPDWLAFNTGMPNIRVQQRRTSAAPVQTIRHRAA